MFLVAGLGNPGPQYVDTRHNVGFLVVDRLARRAMAVFGKAVGGAESVKVRFGTESVVLVKPVRYMNLSGQPTAQLAAFHRVPVEQVVVVHDDMDVPFGDIRVKVGGGHAGHNGLRDLHAHLGSPGYVRVRVGVSRPPPAWDAASYVLGRFTADESARLADVVDRAADAVESIVRIGASATMNHFNTRSADRRAGES